MPTPVVSARTKSVGFGKKQGFDGLQTSWPLLFGCEILIVGTKCGRRLSSTWPLLIWTRREVCVGKGWLMFNSKSAAVRTGMVGRIKGVRWGGGHGGGHGGGQGVGRGGGGGDCWGQGWVRSLGRKDNNGWEEERGCELLYISVPPQWVWGRP